MLALAACVAEDDPDVDFRKANLGGDGDLTLHSHPSAIDDDPIWQFHSGDVYSGSIDDGVLVLKHDDTTIRDENDNVICTREGDALVQRIRDGDSNGPVLYTVIGRQVFAGVPDVSDDPLYSFQGRHVMEAQKGPPLLSANTHLQFASSMRKLVIVSLIEGECGGNGL